MRRRKEADPAPLPELQDGHSGRPNGAPAGLRCVECKLEIKDLPPGLLGVRFHDLRHSAVSRMIAARVPLPIIAKIVGWAPGTMAKMAVRYGHFGIEELRGAVEAISNNGGSLFGHSPYSFHYIHRRIPAAVALTD
jgi:hypothetical protein